MTQPQAYAVTEGDGLPVVFVHGMGVDHRSLMLLDEAFLCPESGAAASRSLKRIYLDLPGFGRTPALPARACGLPEMADWLQSAIDDLVGAGEPFALVGNSMGGALAREMVARESSRVRGLALIASLVDPRRTRRHVAEHVITEPNPTLIHALPQDQTFDFVTMGINQSFAAWRRYQSYILPGIRLCDRDACARLDARYWLNDNPERVFGTYAEPTLFVTGRRDQIVGFEDQRALLSHYPDATFVTLDDAGHNAHIDQPEAVIRLLREWAGRL